MPARMARRALNRRVSPGELEFRELVMVESRQLPVIHAVAGFATRGKSGGAMVDALGLLKILLVTIDTLRAQPSEDACGAAMAGVAGDRGMSPDQRKAVQVILNRFRGDPPSLNRVTVLALRSELAPVEIRVTSRALGPGLGKNVRDVARFTGHVLMHAAQRKLSSAMVELGLRAQRREAGRRVTVLARDRNRPMRSPRCLRLDRWHQP